MGTTMGSMPFVSFSGLKIACKARNWGNILPSVLGAKCLAW